MQFLAVALPLFAAGSALAAPTSSDLSPSSDWSPASGVDPVQSILDGVTYLVTDVLKDIAQITALGHVTVDICVDVNTLLEEIIDVVDHVTDEVAELIGSIVGPLTHDQLALVPSILQVVNHLLEAVDEIVSHLLIGVDADVAKLLGSNLNTISIKINLFVGPINDFSNEKCSSAPGSDSGLVAIITALLKDVDSLLHKLLKDVYHLLHDVLEVVEDLLKDLSK